MNHRRVGAFVILLLVGGLLAFRLTAAQPAAETKQAEEKPPVGRYKISDLPIGKFVYRMLFDTMTADYWLWLNGDWERAEASKNGMPWKDLKPAPGRFQLLSPPVGELDRELYVFDSATGRLWARTIRNRTELLTAPEWREVTLPKPGR